MYFLLPLSPWQVIEKNHEILKSDSWNTEFLGMFYSFHERKGIYTEKESPLLWPTVFFTPTNCLLSAICELAPPNQISYFSPSHHTPATHILPHPEPEVQLPAQPEFLHKHCKWSSQSAWSHWHTQKQAVINWWAEGSSLRRVMANVQISSMLPHTRSWKLFFPPETGSEPIITKTVWPLWAPAPVLDCSHCEVLLELTRISLDVTCAPCLPAFPSVSLRRTWLGLFYHHPFGS